MSDTFTLEVRNVTKLYKNGRGAEDISFTLAPGEVLGLLGPNGSGKTTVMKAIAGLVRPQSGSVHICGVNAADSHEKAMRSVGCLIEQPALYGHMSVEQNLRLAARFYKNVDDRRIDEVLQMVEMDRYRRDKTRSLSLGMRQRVGLASALISGPKLLILDEPANGLDIEGMMYVRDVIKAASAGGTAVLMASHLAKEVEECANSAAVMHSGRLLGIERVDSIMKRYVGLEDYFLAEVAKSNKASVNAFNYGEAGTDI